MFKSLKLKLCAGLLALIGLVGGGAAISQAQPIEARATASIAEFSHSDIQGMATSQPSTATATTGTYGDFTIAIGNGFNADESVRVYKNYDITIASESEYTIIEIIITCTANGTTKYGPGSLTGTGYMAGTEKTGTWSGEATSVTLTASAYQARITDFKITYIAEASSSEEPSEVSEPSSESSAEPIEPITPVQPHVTLTAGEGATDSTVNGKPSIKCGTSKNGGGAMTIEITADYIEKLKLYIAAWSGDAPTITITVNDETIVTPSSITPSSDSGISGSSTNWTLANAESDYKILLELTGAKAGTTLTLSTSANKKRFVVWGVTDLFAETFANTFDDGLTCDNSGRSAPTFTEGYSWESFEALYRGLDAEEQGILHDTIGNESGNIVEQVVARYDYIVGKYGYTDFIGRSPTPNTVHGVSTSITSPVLTPALLWVLSTGMIGLMAIGLLAFVSYKRYN